MNEVQFHKKKTQNAGERGQTVNTHWFDISYEGEDVGYISKSVGSTFFNLTLLKPDVLVGFIKLSDAKERARQEIMKFYNLHKEAEDVLKYFRTVEPTEWSASQRYVYDSIMERARRLISTGIKQSAESAIAEAFGMHFGNQRYYTKFNL